jgi:hypothetical protein
MRVSDSYPLCLVNIQVGSVFASRLYCTLARLADKLMKDYDRIGPWISLHVRPSPVVAAHQSMHNLTLLKLHRSSYKKIPTYTESEGITIPNLKNPTKLSDASQSK